MPANIMYFNDYQALDQWIDVIIGHYQCPSIGVGVTLLCYIIFTCLDKLPREYLVCKRFEIEFVRII